MFMLPQKHLDLRYDDCMEASLYQQHLAKAIAYAPSVEDAQALYRAAGEHAPPITLMLSEAICAQNEPALLACAAQMQQPLTPDEQGQVLHLWRKTPSQPQTHPPESERLTAKTLARLGLIDQSAEVSKYGVSLGPITWMLCYFRETAARELLDHIQPMPDDLAGALVRCTTKLISGPRKDIQEWIDLTYRLLDMGANPDQAAHYKHPTSPDSTPVGLKMSASQQLLMTPIMNPKAIEMVPFELIVRLLGEKSASWTDTTASPYSHFSKWLSANGDLDMAIKIGQGRTLSKEGLVRIFEVSQKNETLREGIWKIFNGDLSFDPITLPEMSELVIESIVSQLSRGNSATRVEHVIKWIKYSADHLPLLTPEDHRTQGRAMIQAFKTIEKTIKHMLLPLSEQETIRVRSELRAIEQAHLLDIDTPHLSKRASNMRL